MADIQLIQCKNPQKASSNRRNIVLDKEMGVKKSNGDVTFFSESSQIAVSVHAQ